MAYVYILDHKTLNDGSYKYYIWLFSYHRNNANKTNDIVVCLYIHHRFQSFIRYFIVYLHIAL